MKFTPTSLAGGYMVEPAPHADNRGWFARTFCKKEFEQIGHDAEWLQMNHSYTAVKGTIRGMHYQLPPAAEVKLVRCISGAVYDVIIDLRQKSPTFLQWWGAELSASNKHMIYIPEGFAHGFQTFTNDCELLYLHTAFYTPGSEAGIMYNDPLVNIRWPLPLHDASERDRHHPLLTSEFKGIEL